ncbi:MAG TPA: hypothetical protein VN578_24525 [Candidatus Binatia bacterium]|nr:hypothetical protein [Candidatus Binatia bacterium]
MKAQLLYSCVKCIFRTATRGGIFVSSAVGLGIALVGTVPALAQPSWYDVASQSGIQPGSPDFYQHQITGTYLNEGFCDYFAYEDAMYYDHNNGFANLYADNAAWVNGMINNFTNIYFAGGNQAPNPAFMNGYIGNKGYAASLGMTPITNSTGGFSIFNNMRSGLLAGSNVLVRIELGPSATNQWWGYHVMDVVGFSSSNHNIIVLDPDNNRYGGYGLPDQSSNAPPMGYLTNGFGYGVPYNLVYNTNSQPLPVENGWGDVGNPTNSLLQAYTLDANGNITDGAYAGTKVTWIYDIGPVPEPSIAALGLVAAATLGARRLTGRKKRRESERNPSPRRRPEPRVVS